MLIRQLVYGPAGAGKSHYANSAWWDPIAKQSIDGKEGLWITMGAEDNPALMIPEKNRKRFSSPSLNDLRWVKEFEMLVRGLIATFKAEGKPAVDVVVFDGFSEFDLLFKQITESVEAEEVKANQFHVWKEIMAKFFTIVQLLQPSLNGSHVIATARRGEVKKYVQRSVGKPREGGKTWTVEEDEWYDGAEAAPSLHGGFRKDLPHYFDYVTYLDTETIIAPKGHKREGTKIPVHQMETMRGGNVYIKNISEQLWLNSDYPTTLTNASFTDFYKIVTDLNGV
jgi:hypothetical protein